MVRRMQPGSVIVDVSIDQGGCVETARATTHARPFMKRMASSTTAWPTCPAPPAAFHPRAEPGDPALCPQASRHRSRCPARGPGFARA
jgi:hypothetical protein